MMKKGLLGESLIFGAFVLLGCLLLLTLWFANEFDRSLLRDFREPQVSLSFEDETAFKRWIVTAPGMKRYRIFSPQVNREKLFEENPRFQTVLSDLDLSFFPTTALVTVNDVPTFTRAFEASGMEGGLYQIHRPPSELQLLVRIVLGVFAFLWAMTLVMMIYFNLDRTAQRLLPRWTLMKTLGARIHQVYRPVLRSQMSWMVGAVVLAILLSRLALEILLPALKGDAQGFSWFYPLSYGLVSLGLALILSFGLFYSRYRQVKLG